MSSNSDDSKHKKKTSKSSYHEKHKSKSKIRNNSSDSRISKKLKKHKKLSHDSRHKSITKNRKHSSNKHQTEKSPELKISNKERNSDHDPSPDLNRQKLQNKNENYDATGFKRGEKRNDSIVFGYTNDSNPFMDQNLSESFIWKKNKKQIKRSIEDNALELENVQKRQREHEKLREERLMEQELLQRAKEAESYVGRKTDSSFDIEQARNRSKIRIADGRAKPIDLLIEYVHEEENLEASNADVINHEPCDFIVGLSRPDLEDLLVDIHEYSRNMEPGKNTQYWEDVLTVTEDELEKVTDGAIKVDKSEETVKELKMMVLESSISEAEKVVEEAREVLKKPGNEGHIDPSFYEFFVRLGSVLLARRRLHERHLTNLRANLDKLRLQQGVMPDKPLFPSVVAETRHKHHKSSSSKTESKSKTEKKSSSHKKPDTKELAACSSGGEPSNAREPYERCYSPVLVQELAEEESLDNVIYDAADDSQKLAYLRQNFLRRGANIGVEGEAALLDRVAIDTTAAAAAADEEAAVEQVEQVSLAPQSFLWSDKYRPRRPRFLNRVNTGFDWNKYNQTHYDTDNPPPKVVQGYKFNILYPDLIDKSRTPTFEVAPCPDDDQYAVLTFKAGPPYEDIAFKVVNREWETSERHGYKCQFYRDTLQLYFHFKRYRYRK